MAKSVMILIIFTLCTLIFHLVRADSIALYPRDTKTRQIQSLDGVWNFRLQNQGQDGFTEKWFEKELYLARRI